MRELSRRLILTTACLLLPAGLLWLGGFFRAGPAGRVDAGAAGLPAPRGTPLPEGVANAEVPLDPSCMPLQAAFSWQAQGLTVSFTNESVGEPPLSYGWAFGDGADSTEEAPTHTYALSGTYAVSLLVYNRCGGDTVVHPVRVGYSAGVYLPMVFRSWVEPAPPGTPASTPTASPPPICGIYLSAGPTFDGDEVYLRITNGGTTSPSLYAVSLWWEPWEDPLRELYWSGTSIWSGIEYDYADLAGLSGELPAGATRGLRFRFESGPISQISFQVVFDNGCSISYLDPHVPTPLGPSQTPPP